MSLEDYILDETLTPVFNTDTFETWRIKTNDIVSSVNGINETLDLFAQSDEVVHLDASPAQTVSQTLNFGGGFKLGDELNGTVFGVDSGYLTLNGLRYKFPASAAATGFLERNVSTGEISVVSTDTIVNNVTNTALSNLQNAEVVNFTQIVPVGTIVKWEGDITALPEDVGDIKKFPEEWERLDAVNDSEGSKIDLALKMGLLSYDDIYNSTAVGDAVEAINIIISAYEPDLQDYIIKTGYEPTGVFNITAGSGITLNGIDADLESIPYIDIRGGTISLNVSSDFSFTGDALSIADGAISNAKLADGSVSNAKIADGSITAAKLDESALSAFGTVTAANFGQTGDAPVFAPRAWARLNPYGPSNNRTLGYKSGSYRNERISIVDHGLRAGDRITIGYSAHSTNRKLHSVASVGTTSQFVVSEAFSAPISSSTQNRFTRVRVDDAPTGGSLSTPSVLNVSSTAFNGTIHKILRCTVGAQAGKYIVVGEFTSFSGSSVNRIIRLNENGTRDSTFASGTAFNGPVYDVLEDADGTLIVCGGFTTYQGSSISTVPANGGIVRLNANGSRNTDFIAGLEFPTPSTLPPRRLAFSTGGKILVGGDFSSYDGTTVGHLVQINANGSVDLTFNSGGSGLSGGRVRDIVFDTTSSKIIVSGRWTTYNGTSIQNGILRLSDSGVVDVTFSTAGSGFASAAEVYSISYGSTTVTCGGSFGSYNGVTVGNLVRITLADGSRDASFQGSTNDIVRILSSYASSILVGGDFTLLNGFSRQRFGKLNSDGALTYDGDLCCSLNGSVNNILLLPAPNDTTAVLVGSFTSFSPPATGTATAEFVRIQGSGNVSSASYVDSPISYIPAMVLNFTVPLPNANYITTGSGHWSHNVAHTLVFEYTTPNGEAQLNTPQHAYISFNELNGGSSRFQSRFINVMFIG